MWYTAGGLHHPLRIGRITSSGQLREFVVRDQSQSANMIAAGADGALWITQTGAGRTTIARVTVDGAVTEFTTPGNPPDHLPRNLVGIVLGPDGGLWFPEAFFDKIGRITTSGMIMEFPLATRGAEPSHIAAGPDGALWFIEPGVNRIGRMTTKGEVREYDVPTRDSDLVDIAAGPDGAMWFTEYRGQRIGRVDSNGNVTEFAVAELGPVGLTAGPDGAVWFAAAQANAIARITTTGSVTVYPIPTANSTPYRVASGDGGIWFTEQAAAQIGRVVLR